MKASAVVLKRCVVGRRHSPVRACVKKERGSVTRSTARIIQGTKISALALRLVEDNTAALRGFKAGSQMGVVAGIWRTCTGL